MTPVSFIPSADNSVLTVKFTSPDCVFEFQTEAVNGLHPFKKSNLTVDEFDKLESYPVDAMFLNVVDNNAAAFNSMKS
jgi:hypothetical protein